jgi:hypothetical protein
MRRGGDLAAAANDADDDPVAARSHPLDQRIDHIHVGKELGVESGAPGRRRQFIWRRSSRGAGGIDQHIDRPDPAFDRLDHRGRRRGVGKIGGDSKRVFEFGAGALDIVMRARADGDPGAFGGEGLRAREPNALRPAGDENDPTCQTEVHQPSFEPLVISSAA